MNDQSNFELGLLSRGEAAPEAESHQYPRTVEDAIAAKKSTDWKAGNQLSLPPVVKGLGDMAVEGQGLAGMAKEVETIPVDYIAGPAEKVDVHFSEIDGAL